MLAVHTTLGLGGPAGRVIDARDEDRLVAAVMEADACREPVLILAGGSNVVIADAGFDGVAVRVLTTGVRRTAGEHGRVLLDVAAGESWDAFVEGCVRDGLSGIEALAGIPGSVGATPIQNVGAYGQEVSETVAGVRVLDRRTGEIAELDPAACGFGYRDSRFKARPGRHVILGVRFELEAGGGASRPVRYAELARTLGVSVGERAPVGDVRRAVLALRRGKGMVLDPGDPDTRSAGSFFTNPVLSAEEFSALAARAAAAGLGAPPAWEQPDGDVKTSAAWLIERAGTRRGEGDPEGIAVSAKHVLALTNRGAGTTAELVALARVIAGRVAERFGVELRPEPVFVGHEW